MSIIGPAPATPTPAVLTLSKTTFLTAPPDIIAYVIRQFCSAPKSLTETYWDYNISMVDIVSIYSGNSAKIAEQAQQQLSSVFNRIFSNGSVTVTATPIQLTNPFDYTIEISVLVVINGRTYSISSDITVDPNGRLVIN